MPFRNFLRTHGFDGVASRLDDLDNAIAGFAAPPPEPYVNRVRVVEQRAVNETPRTAPSSTRVVKYSDCYKKGCQPSMVVCPECRDKPSLPEGIPDIVEPFDHLDSLRSLIVCRKCRKHTATYAVSADCSTYIYEKYCFNEHRYASIKYNSQDEVASFRDNRGAPIIFKVEYVPRV